MIVFVRVFICLAVCFCSSINAKRHTALRTYGDTFQIVIPVSALVATWYNDDMEGCKQLFKSFTASIVTTTAIKAIIHTRRPKGNGKHSFPSQHTSASFSGAGFLGSRYGWKYGVPSYTAAALVGYSRINAKAHNITDVLGGAAISLGFNFLFVKKYEDPSYMKTPVVVQKEAEGYKPNEDNTLPSKPAKKPSAAPLAKKMRDQFKTKKKEKK